MVQARVSESRQIRDQRSTISGAWQKMYINREHFVLSLRAKTKKKHPVPFLHLNLFFWRLFFFLISSFPPFSVTPSCVGDANCDYWTVNFEDLLRFSTLNKVTAICCYFFVVDFEYNRIANLDVVFFVSFFSICRCMYQTSICQNHIVNSLLKISFVRLRYLKVLVNF